jgi:hypothetical protein
MQASEVIRHEEIHGMWFLNILNGLQRSNEDNFISCPPSTLQLMGTSLLLLGSRAFSIKGNSQFTQ